MLLTQTRSDNHASPSKLRLMRLGPLLLTLTLAASAQELHHGKKHPNPHHARSAAEWERVLENPARDAWQKPAQVVEALNIQRGQSVADIGAGTGYFSVRLAQAVGNDGKLYAVDVQQDLIDHLAARAKEANLPQLIPTLGAFDAPKLPAESLDLIFICDVVHHIENRPAYYAKLAAALKRGGRLAIVDFYKRDLPVGPAPPMKIARDAMIEELRQAGFSLVQEHKFLSHQYFLVFQPGWQ